MTWIPTLASALDHSACNVCQQYLHKNPNGYRCHSDTGVPYPG